jgi:hypothetical protein
MTYHQFKSPVGTLHLYANDSALLGLYFDTNHDVAKKRFAGLMLALLS